MAAGISGSCVNEALGHTSIPCSISGKRLYAAATNAVNNIGHSIPKRQDSSLNGSFGGSHSLFFVFLGELPDEILSLCVAGR
jgi:hypothetical protein